MNSRTRRRMTCDGVMSCEWHSFSNAAFRAGSIRTVSRAVLFSMGSTGRGVGADEGWAEILNTCPLPNEAACRGDDTFFVRVFPGETALFRRHRTALAAAARRARQRRE